MRSCVETPSVYLSLSISLFNLTIRHLFLESVRVSLETSTLPEVNNLNTGFGTEKKWRFSWSETYTVKEPYRMLELVPSIKGNPTLVKGHVRVDPGQVSVVRTVDSFHSTISSVFRFVLLNVQIKNLRRFLNYGLFKVLKV